MKLDEGDSNFLEFVFQLLTLESELDWSKYECQHALLGWTQIICLVFQSCPFIK